MIERTPGEEAAIRGRDAYDLQDCLRNRERQTQDFRGFLVGVIEGRVWEHPRTSSSGRTWPPSSFHDFVHGTGPADLCSSYDAIERVIQALPDNEKYRQLWEEASGRTIAAKPVTFEVPHDLVARLDAYGEANKRSEWQTVDRTIRKLLDSALSAAGFPAGKD